MKIVGIMLGAFLAFILTYPIFIVMPVGLYLVRVNMQTYLKQTSITVDTNGVIQV